MKTNFKLLFTGLMTTVTLTISAQNTETQSFKVLGNCGMCEKTIESAAVKSGAKKAEWNKDSKILALQFNPKKVSADVILKAVAYAGYDNEKYLAPNSAYENLHECCKYERPKIAGNGTNTQEQSTDTKTTQQSQKKNELEQVYNSYFNLKDALVKSDKASAAKEANAVLTALDAVKMNDMGEKEHNAFMKHLSGIKSDAKTISEAKDIAKQRDQFSVLSDRLFDLMKTVKPSYTVHLENCPMFNDGKGANWISKESAIKNPYYGSQMLTCGKVKETLK